MIGGYYGREIMSELWKVDFFQNKYRKEMY